MDAVGTVYKMKGSSTKDFNRELDSLEGILNEAGFKLVRTGGSKIYICDGGTRLNYKQHIAGLIDGPYLYTHHSKRLDEFLVTYDFPKD
ncbi:hypothetical protein GOV03_03300 [Candidatus Woesearchaeota archaeon]|nr:hypothetical protein [Candidatus Woesearchaeota archaeon]